MNKFSIFFVILIISIVFTNCRKGEEDPWLSLKSRNARITGRWHLTKLSGSHEVINTTHGYEFFDCFYDIKASDKFQTMRSWDGFRIILYYDYFECRMNIYDDNTMTVRYYTIGESNFNWGEDGAWEWDNETGKRKEYAELEAFFPNVKGYSYRVIALSKEILKLEVKVDDTFYDEDGNKQQVIGSYTYEFIKTENL